MAEKPLTDWNNGLFDCFEDVSSCCYGFWCCPCLAGTLSRKFGESNFLPLCDICGPVVLTISGICRFSGICGIFGLCCIPVYVPPAALALRSAMRNRYGIKGSIFKDIAASCFCMWCSWCQMYREVKDRNNVPVYINMQPQSVVNMQPTAMMMVPVSHTKVGFVSQSGVIMPAP